jgi:O-6-methylguanine DNA methyltransferase
MGAIVESTGVSVARTEYGVDGWGVGELWTSDGVVVAHDFGFDHFSGRGRVERLGTKATFLGTRPDPAVREVTSLDAEPRAPRRDRSAHLLDGDLIERVRAFLGGREVAWDDIELDLDWCTEFQRDVLTVLRGVPRGEVVSYGELAALAGRPGAQRAVGTICASNRYAFFVPCHRVVGADGIGGYGSAGVAVKRRLLALEDVSL